MTSKQRFLAALNCQPLDRPPIWVMRQAGRYLPEYRALKEKYSFLELAQTPELALEVTMQPLRRFPLDAAILFSDILVIPEAMGQGYHFRDQGGIGMDYTLDSASQIEQLTTDTVTEKLDYVAQALRLIAAELDSSKMLLGFGGSPWTLATYMVEGGSSKNFDKIKALYYEDRATYERLLEKISDALIAYFKMQHAAGADAIQIFDSWGGILSGEDYEDASLKWIRKIIDAVKDDVSIILYAKGTTPHLKRQAACGPKAVAVDWTVPIEEAAAQIPANIAIQGNLDPVLLNTTPSIVQDRASRILSAMKNRPGHIFNLGHGILPTAKIENMEALCHTITTWKA
ncbi:uroporphyrinogen decarboxylase [Pelagicoccus sp. SDUM812003]|uniref:uroporphyrinogen decarboxylase n=1 Tax=Pelagicoccus sp. SDUM812003 TaxID=3041267 RepID=UPI00281069B3|nr:uroporphyrinogen decarboxylase [Pelagicoccus sp. SDUM812003]MDQ8204923.1 uroporphyrinogen decarboxylase [Pelagicoccus sp. SDUM812003]